MADLDYMKNFGEMNLDIDSDAQIEAIGWKNGQSILRDVQSRMIKTEIEEKIRCCELSYRAAQVIIDAMCSDEYKITLSNDIEPDFSCVPEYFSQSKQPRPNSGGDGEEDPHAIDVEHWRAINYLQWKIDDYFKRGMRPEVGTFCESADLPFIYYETGSAKYLKGTDKLHSFVCEKQELRLALKCYPFNLLTAISGEWTSPRIISQECEAVTDAVLDTLEETAKNLIAVRYKYQLTGEELLARLELPQYDTLLWAYEFFERWRKKAIRKLRHPSRSKSLKRMGNPYYDREFLDRKNSSNKNEECDGDVAVTLVTKATEEVSELLRKTGTESLKELRRVYRRKLPDCLSSAAVFYDIRLLNRELTNAEIRNAMSTLPMEYIRTSLIEDAMPQLKGKKLKSAFIGCIYGEFVVLVLCSNGELFPYVSTWSNEKLEFCDFSSEVNDALKSAVQRYAICLSNPSRTAEFCRCCAASVSDGMERRFYEFLAQSFSNETTSNEAVLKGIHIEDLNLSVRSFNCLKRSNIHIIEDLLELSANDLMRIRNLGRRSVIEIVEKVTALGLTWIDKDSGKAMLELF